VHPTGQAKLAVPLPEVIVPRSGEQLELNFVSIIFCLLAGIWVTPLFDRSVKTPTRSQAQGKKGVGKGGGLVVSLASGPSEHATTVPAVDPEEKPSPLVIIHADRRTERICSSICTGNYRDPASVSHVSANRTARTQAE